MDLESLQVCPINLTGEVLKSDRHKVKASDYLAVLHQQFLLCAGAFHASRLHVAPDHLQTAPQMQHLCRYCISLVQDIPNIPAHVFAFAVHMQQNEMVKYGGQRVGQANLDRRQTRFPV